MTDRRSYNFFHNSLIGSACRGRADMHRIMRAPSASPVAQEMAARIDLDMARLADYLRNHRINQDGSLWTRDGEDE